MQLNNNLNTEDRKRFAKGLTERRNDRWALFVEILIRTGMRSEELARFDASQDINEQKNTIFINAAKGSKNRIVPIEASLTRAILTTFRCPILDFVELSSPSFKRQLARKFDKLKLEILGIGYSRVTLHGLRATFAQAVYEKCDNDILLVKDLLGHKKIDSTMVYVEALKFEQKFAKIKKAI